MRHQILRLERLATLADELGRHEEARHYRVQARTLENRRNSEVQS